MPPLLRTHTHNHTHMLIIWIWGFLILFCNILLWDYQSKIWKMTTDVLTNNQKGLSLGLSFWVPSTETWPKRDSVDTPITIVREFVILLEWLLWRTFESRFSIDIVKHRNQGIPWWPSGYDSALPLQGALVRSLVGGKPPAVAKKKNKKQNKT